MADSLDAGFRASLFGKKPKVKKGKQERAGDTPEAREARIQLYMSRANVDVSAERATPRKGLNGRPLSIFTGEEYTEEELRVEGDVNDDE